ncbi:MAG TPA: phosphatase PAP2 family protein [Anaerolineales bacterium]|nr:phosphatase PAP2 family protein [Anaerolineales bacterium]
MGPALKKRIALVLGAFLIQAVYTPTSLFMTGGIEPRLPIDVFRLWVVWVIPYIACYPLWTFCIAWLIWKSDDRLFRAAVTGLFFTFSLGISIYILFPTYVVQPELTGTDILSKILLSIQVAGGDHDAFPSSHIYTTVVLACFYHDWYPRHKWLWLFIVAIVSLSTLFTGQHYIADVLGGYLTGWLGYRFGLWWNTMDGKFKQRKTSHA